MPSSMPPRSLGDSNENYTLVCSRTPPSSYLVGTEESNKPSSEFARWFNRLWSRRFPATTHCADERNLRHSLSAVYLRSGLFVCQQCLLGNNHVQITNQAGLILVQRNVSCAFCIRYGACFGLRLPGKIVDRCQLILHVTIGNEDRFLVLQN